MLFAVSVAATVADVCDVTHQLHCISEGEHIVMANPAVLSEGMQEYLQHKSQHIANASA